MISSHSMLFLQITWISSLQAAEAKAKAEEAELKKVKEEEAKVCLWQGVSRSTSGDYSKHALPKFFCRAHIFSRQILVVHRLLLKPRRRLKKRNLKKQRPRPLRQKLLLPPLLQSRPLLPHLNQHPPLPLHLALVEQLLERFLDQLQEERFFRRKNSTLRSSSYSRNKCKIVMIAFVFYATTNFKLCVAGKMQALVELTNPRTMAIIRFKLLRTMPLLFCCRWKRRIRHIINTIINHSSFHNLLLVYPYSWFRNQNAKCCPKPTFFFGTLVGLSRSVPYCRWGTSSLALLQYVISALVWLSDRPIKRASFEQ